MPFAPAVAIELSTPAPKAPAGIVATVTQRSGESAIRTIDAVFPTGFTYNEGFRLRRCLPGEEAGEACPPDSRVGTVTGVSPIATGTGEVFVTGDLRLVSFVRAAGGLVQFKVTGTITIDPSGGFAVGFAGTPDIPLTSLTLDLQDGERSLVRNPARCGEHRFAVTLVSHQDERVEADPAVTISGCPPRLSVSAVKVTPGRPRPGKAFRLRWRVSPGTEATRVVVLRRGKAVRRRTVTGTSVRMKGLRRGRYVAKLSATSAGRTSSPTRLAFAVRK